MAYNNKANLNGTGIVTSDGDGTFSYSTVTQNAVLLAGANDTITDTGVLSKGVILVGDGTTAPTLLTVGTNDHVLTADSAQTSGVKWAAVAAGGGSGWVLLSTATASTSSSLNFTSSIDSTYEVYAFVFHDLRPTTDGDILCMRTSANAGSSWDSGAADYEWIMAGVEPGTGGCESDFDDSEIQFGSGSFDPGNVDPNESIAGVVYMFAPSIAAQYTRFVSDYGCRGTTGQSISGFMHAYRNDGTNAVTGVQFFFQASTIASGSIKLYGVGVPS